MEILNKQITERKPTGTEITWGQLKSKMEECILNSTKSSGILAIKYTTESNSNGDTIHIYTIIATITAETKILFTLNINDNNPEDCFISLSNSRNKKTDLPSIYKYINGLMQRLS